MTEKESALYSHYIIDGVRLDMTPAELLDECMEYEEVSLPSGFDDIIDESTEPPLSAFKYEPSEENAYIDLVQKAISEERPFRMLYPGHFTRLQIAKALLSRLWSEGHFKLCDLKLWIQWEWNTRPLGSMAAFYHSAESASEYIYGLGLNIADYLFIEIDEASSAKFYAWLPQDIEDDNEQEDRLFKSSPYESNHPWISEKRRCPAHISKDAESWIIYIPFDTCKYKLGDSLLTQIKGHNGGKSPDISDPDYFIDCYEVVRELVEDGIVMAGANVCDGGLLPAAEIMCGKIGMDIDLKGILSSYQEASRAEILFGEVPGVLLQVSNENYDYMDSQLLLQDIAYYPLGHPSVIHKGVNVSENGKTGVAEILLSLLGQATEGED